MRREVNGQDRDMQNQASAPRGHFVGGRWTTAVGELIAVIDSVTEQVFGRVAAGTTADVDVAVAAAQAAFPSWAARSGRERAEILRAVADGIEARHDEFADVITRETGMARKLSLSVQVALPIHSFRAAADLAEQGQPTEAVANSVIVREPIGVVGAITPWNYPLHQSAAKIAFALAAGCTVVHKPSDVAPIDALLLAEVFEKISAPPGVLNVVNGTGAVVGAAMAAHPGINMITFTGSTRVGAEVLVSAARSIKKVALELGGKSAAVVAEHLDDDTIAAAIRDTVAKCFLNSGQTCNALTRLIVPRADIERVEAAVRAAVERLVVGDPFDEATRLGPLASAAQRRTVRDYIELGRDEGAKLLLGGVEPPPHLARGFYVMPTVFSEVTPAMRIAQEEIFGPVLCIMPYDSIDEAIATANATRYGLAGSVWAKSDDDARALAMRIQAGQIDINGGRFNPDAPFGGYKQSGLGREFGVHGLAEFLELKSLQLSSPRKAAAS
jgi:acyl-CoA reductase-like NAD-dependent aldehyde dehydrogenase